MPRPRSQPPTVFARAVTDARGDRSLMDVGAQLGLDYTTLSSIERGKVRPSFGSAAILARWLGWTMEQVYEAANTPVSAAEATLP